MATQRTSQHTVAHVFYSSNRVQQGDLWCRSSSHCSLWRSSFPRGLNVAAFYLGHCGWLSPCSSCGFRPHKGQRSFASELARCTLLGWWPSFRAERGTEADQSLDPPQLRDGWHLHSRSLVAVRKSSEATPAWYKSCDVSHRLPNETACWNFMSVSDNILLASQIQNGRGLLAPRETTLGNGKCRHQVHCGARRG